MNFYEQERAEELKRKIIQDQDGFCANPECDNQLDFYGPPQLAHRVAKSKANLKKYGAKVIHHRLNLAAVCCLNCNSAMLINPDSLPGHKLIMIIRAEIEGEE